MTTVYLSLGSNIERQRNIAAALDALADNFGELIVSTVYESEAVGFKGDNFYNLVVAIQTQLPVGELSNCLKSIEDKNGRTRLGPKFSGRTLDIDILTYGLFFGEIDGVELPRDEITKNAFVLCPMAEIAGLDLHPELKQSYEELWQAYDHASQHLWPVDFTWRDEIISRAN